MNSSDLRVGNLVQYNCFPMHVVAVYQDGTVYCDFKENEGDVWEFDKNNPCVGIELTEEILLKCGFEKRKDGNFNLFKQSEVDIVIDKEFSAWKCDGINFSVGCIKYLHQLQNLYYALCNEELNVEL